MHDLNTIRRLNAEAFADAIANLRRQGRDVVATYAGSALMSIESFSIREEALAAVQAPTDSPDEHRALYVGYQPVTTFPPIELQSGAEQQLSPTCDGSGNCAECEHNREHNEQGHDDDVHAGFRVIHLGNLEQAIGAILGRQL